MERKRRKLNLTIREETYEKARRAAEAADTSISRYVEGLILGVPYGRHLTPATPSVQQSKGQPGSGRPHRKFEPPTFQDVVEFATENAIKITSAEKFYHHFASQSWSAGKKKLWDWKERLQEWSVEDEMRAAQRREDNIQRAALAQKKKNGFLNFESSGTDWNAVAQTIADAQEAEDALRSDYY